MKQVVKVTDAGQKYIDTGEDDAIDKFLAKVQPLIDATEKKNMEQSDSLRDKRMAGLPSRRKRKT